MTNSADPDHLASSDLDLHYLLRQGMSCSAREGLISKDLEFKSDCIFKNWYLETTIKNSNIWSFLKAKYSGYQLF